MSRRDDIESWEDRPRKEKTERDRQEPERSGMPAWLIVLLIAGVLSVLVGGAVAAFVVLLRTETRSGPVVKADFGQLLAEWEKNPVAVVERYRGSRVEITGHVKEISSNIHHQTYVILSPAEGADRGGRTAQVFLLDGDLIAQMKDYPIGSRVTFEVTIEEVDSRLRPIAHRIVPPAGGDPLPAADRKTPDRPGGDGSQALDWSKVGNALDRGDLRITIPYAIAGPVWGPCPDFVEGPTQGETLLYFKVRIENRSTTRLYRWDGWQGTGRATDEHGNRYRPIKFARGTPWYTTPRGPDGKFDREVALGGIYAFDVSIEPGKTYTGFLFYERPVETAREARLTVPARAFEGQEGELHFCVPITRLRAGREEQPRKDEERAAREKADAEGRLHKQREDEARTARQRREQRERKKAARVRAIVERLQSDKAGEQVAALKEASPVAAALPEAAQIRALDLLKSSPDAQVRASAFALLRARKAERLALPVLVNHLDSESTPVRQQAVEMLAHLRPTDPKVIAKLVDALDHKDTALRAVTTLGKTGKPAVAALRGNLKADFSDTRRYTILALSYMGPDAAEALPDLEVIADKDPSPAVSAAARTAIKRIKGD